MKQVFILLIATVVVFVAPGVQGTAHLSFITNMTANVARTGCGTDKLCIETPDDCDPSTNNSCLFTSVNGTTGVAPNGTTLSFQLSGANRTGDIFIAVALTANASEGNSTVYICGRNQTASMTNGTFFFRTMLRNNTSGMLSATERNVTGIKNFTTSNRLQCEFDVPGLNASARAGDTTFVVLLASGTVNGSNLLNFTANVTTAALNLTDPASNLNNNTNTTTSSVNIARTGCGTDKLCVEAPDDCDPATNNSCLFVSARLSGPTTANSIPLLIELSGANRTGDRYIGVALTANPSESTAVLYICGRNGSTNATSGTFLFRILQRNANGSLTVLNTTAAGLQNSTSATKIQCVFNITLTASSGRAAALSSAIQLGSGSVNGSNLGNFTANVTTAVLDLTNPASNLNTSSVNITRTGCGTEKLCIETPEDCDPATNNSCLFTSVDGTPGVAPNGTTLSFELSGANNTGDRYIGVALTANASEGTSMLYVCGRNGTTSGVNGTFFFLTVQRNNVNGSLTVMNGNATVLQNLTSSTKIQCVFNITGVNATARAADTTFVVLLGSGSVNGSTLGNFTANVTTAALNLLDPASNLNNTTTTPPTSGANSALFPQAVLLLLSIFVSILRTA